MRWWRGDHRKILKIIDMKKELIAELFTRFEEACYIFHNLECWSARELQEIFGYSDWRNFVKVIEKARNACTHSGEKSGDHFVDLNRMIEIGKGAQRQIDDIALTRYACYLVAQNGDSAKTEVLKTGLWPISFRF